MSAFDVDPVLRRIERVAIGFCLAMAAIALAIGGGDPALAIGVLGGGLIVGVSYWAIRTSISGLVDALAPSGGCREGDAPRPKPRPLAIVARLTARYALLALLAYVMIARLRLHPIGLVIGASAVVVATTFEAMRMLAGPRRPTRR